MKKLIILLAICVALCGCSVQEAVTTTPVAETTTTTTTTTTTVTETTTTVPAGPDEAAVSQLRQTYEELFGGMTADPWMENAWVLPVNNKLIVAMGDTFYHYAEDENCFYSNQRFGLMDLNQDGLPELVLVWEEAEIGALLLCEQGGEAVLCDDMTLNNQGGDSLLAVYQRQDKRLLVSQGATGTGAGNYYFTEYAGSSLMVKKADFDSFDDYDSQKDAYFRVYEVQEERVEQEAYQAAQDAFFADLTKVEDLTLLPLGSDPVAALNAALDAFFAK